MRLGAMDSLRISRRMPARPVAGPRACVRRGHAPTPREQMLTWPVERVVVAGEDRASALAPYARIPPYQFMAAVKEGRVALIESYMLSSVSHHRMEGYERLARELHPDLFGEEPK